MNNNIPQELLNILHDAARYRALQKEATLRDPYDEGRGHISSWNWIIELPSGKCKGITPPSDTPTFQETVDSQVPHNLELEEIVETLSPELFEKLNSLLGY